MKKFINVLLCVVMTIVLTLSFAACSGSETPEAPAANQEPAVPEETPAAQETNAAESFLEAFCEFDFAAAAKFMDDPEGLDGISMIDSLKEEGGMSDEVINDFVDGLKAHTTYTITNVTEENGNTIYEFEFSMPDVENMDFEKFQTEFLEKYSEEELANMTEEEITEIIFGMVIDGMADLDKKVADGHLAVNADGIIVAAESDFDFDAAE